MSQNHSKVHAALAIACIALALSVYAAIRGGAGDAKPTGTCVDQEARDQTARLRQALAERDAIVTRLVRAGAPGAGSAVSAPSSPSPPGTPPEPGPRRYTHFEIPNPAVSVTQKDDGTYDIRTTDPALAGSVLQITAVTPSGEEDKLLIRIP